MSETFLDLIQIAEKEIRRDSEDLTRLKRRYPGFDFIPIASNGSSNGVQSEPSEMEKTVLNLINEQPDQEWTSRSVVTVIAASKLCRLPEKDDAAMNAVAATLIALKDAKRITRTHEGRGRDPHRYTANMGVKDKEPAEAGS